MKKTSKKLKITVDDLRFGMYISELDKSWLDTPFLFQGFVLSTQEEVKTLRDHCQYVWVDPEKSTLEYKPLAKMEEDAQKTNEMASEYQRTHNAFVEARESTNQLLSRLDTSQLLNVSSATSTVQNCVDSIMRNSNAMLWMSKIRHSDNYTSEHCLNVCILSIAFGKYLGKKGDELEALGLCGLLHDVGKVKIPKSILNKPSKFLPEEWEIMKSHAKEGYLLLKASGDEKLSEMMQVARDHHERADGFGYPDSKTGDQLSWQTKVVSLTDAFDAMTAHRCYSPSITPSKAVSIIKKDAGTAFDLELAKQFIEFIGPYPPGTIVELHNGRLGIVMERNTEFKHLPNILVVQEEDEWLEPYQAVDLSDIEKGKLGEEWLIKTDHVDGYNHIFTRNFSNYILKM